jgi:hypothetical protein
VLRERKSKQHSTTKKKRNRPDLAHHKEKHEQLHAKFDFFIEINKITTGPWSSLAYLPHLIIRIKNRFLTHFYFKHYKNEIGK